MSAAMDPGERANSGRPDAVLLLATAGVAALGALNQYAAWYGRATAAAHCVRQLAWTALGALAGAALALADPARLRAWALRVYALATAGLLLPFMTDHAVRGVHRWAQLGPLQVQPAEFATLATLVALAAEFSARGTSSPLGVRDLARPAALVLLPCALMVAQPNFGTAQILLLAAAGVVALFGLTRGALMACAGAIAAAAPVVWYALMHPYHRERFYAFLDAEGTRAGAGYQVMQSLLSVSAGSWAGRGWLHAEHARVGVLPDGMTDFPFAVWAEEHGLLGVALLLGLYALIVLRALRLAGRAPDRFGRALGVGIAGLLFWHVAINVGMALGVLPVVGVPLPLFSFGGSNAATVLAGIGLLTGIARRGESPPGLAQIAPPAPSAYRRPWTYER